MSLFDLPYSTPPALLMPPGVACSSCCGYLLWGCVCVSVRHVTRCVCWRHAASVRLTYTHMFLLTWCVSLPTHI